MVRRWVWSRNLVNEEAMAHWELLHQEQNTNYAQLDAHAHTHTHTHTYSIGLLWTSDKLLSEAASCQKHYKHKRRTSMPSAGFEFLIPAIKRPQTYALDRTATGFGPVWWHGRIVGVRSSVRIAYVLNFAVVKYFVGLIMKSFLNNMEHT